jgi:hypothetical protein
MVGAIYKPASAQATKHKITCNGRELPPERERLACSFRRLTEMLSGKSETV